MVPAAMNMLMAHVRTAPIPVSQRTAGSVPPALAAVVMRCLEKDPGDRYAGVGELAAALAECELDRAWTRERAAAWWREHGGASSSAAPPQTAPPAGLSEAPTASLGPTRTV